MGIERLPLKFLYVVGEEDPCEPHKIGICNRPAGQAGSRILGDLQRGNPRRLSMWHVIDMLTEPRAAAAEAHFKNTMRAHWVMGEWFRVDRETAIAAAEATALFIRQEFEKPSYFPAQK